MEIKRGLTYSKNDEVETSEKIVLRSNNINLDNHQFDFTELKYLKPSFDIPADKYLQKGDLLMCMSNGSKAHLGKVALYEGDSNRYAFGGFMAALSHKDSVIGKYLFYAMTTPMYKEYIKALSDGANINNLKVRDIEAFTIPVPPLSEQERMVSLLDTQFAKIDALKANVASQLQAAKDLFQAALKQLLTPQEGWEEKELKSIGKTQTGCTPSMSHKEYYDEEYIPFIKPSEINYDGIGGINYDTQKLSKLGAENGRVFEANSIFMVCIGTIGKLGYSKKVASCNQQINVLTPSDKYNSKFVYYALLNPTFQNEVEIIAKSAQATLPIISKGKWEKLTISFPSLPEQERIAARLDKISEKVKALQANYDQTIILCNDLKQSLLKSIFA